MGNELMSQLRVCIQSPASRDYRQAAKWMDIQSVENMNSQPGQGIEVPSVASPLPASLLSPEGQGFKTYSQLSNEDTELGS